MGQLGCTLRRNSGLPQKEVSQSGRYFQLCVCCVAIALAGAWHSYLCSCRHTCCNACRASRPDHPTCIGATSPKAPAQRASAQLGHKQGRRSRRAPHGPPVEAGMAPDEVAPVGNAPERHARGMSSDSVGALHQWWDSNFAWPFPAVRPASCHSAGMEARVACMAPATRHAARGGGSCNVILTLLYTSAGDLPLGCAGHLVGCCSSCRAVLCACRTVT